MAFPTQELVFSQLLRVEHPGFRARELRPWSAAAGPVAMGSMGIVQFGGQEKGHLSVLWAPVQGAGQPHRRATSPGPSAALRSRGGPWAGEGSSLARLTRGSWLPKALAFSPVQLLQSLIYSQD